MPTQLLPPYSRFTGTWEAYAENYCFISNTMTFIPAHIDPIWPTRRAATRICWYQWIPLLLALQAFVCVLPRLIWQASCPRSGQHLPGRGQRKLQPEAPRTLKINLVSFRCSEPVADFGGGGQGGPGGGEMVSAQYLRRARQGGNLLAGRPKILGEGGNENLYIRHCSDHFVDFAFTISKGAFRFPPGLAQASGTLLHRSASGKWYENVDQPFPSTSKCGMWNARCGNERGCLCMYGVGLRGVLCRDKREGGAELCGGGAYEYGQRGSRDASGGGSDSYPGSSRYAARARTARTLPRPSHQLLPLW